MVIFNYNPEDIIDVKHICFYVDSSSHIDITLMEVVELTIKHPEAPKYAVVKKFDTRPVNTYNRFEFNSGHAIVIEAAQRAAKMIENKN